MIRVVIDSLHQSLLKPEHCVILLKSMDEASERYLPIGSNRCEVQWLYVKLDQKQSARPLTYDFFFQFVRQSNLNIETAYINSIRNGVFSGGVRVARRDLGTRHRFTVDCRATDALLTAVQFEVPIYVAEPVMQAVSITKEQLSGMSFETAAQSSAGDSPSI